MEKYLKDIIEKQNEKIEEIRDVMLWRTNKFKTMVVEWEIANEKVKAMDNHLTNYILDSDKAHGKSIERRDTKIEEQAKRIKELEHELAIEADGEEHIGLYVNNLQEEHAKLKERIKELEDQLGHSYDSGLEAVHPEDTSEHYLPEPTPEERKAYNKDRIREFIKEHLQEDPRDYPEEHSE